MVVLIFLSNFHNIFHNGQAKLIPTNSVQRLPFLHILAAAAAKSLSRVQLLVTPWTAAYQAPPSMRFSRQEYRSGVPLPSLILYSFLYLKIGDGGVGRGREAAVHCLGPKSRCHFHVSVL